ncbi:MAG: metal ABC transporter permease [Trueperaceae bacterium]|nr:metal ABC transporter permease [Trueperaceae bacterium]
MEILLEPLQYAFLQRALLGGAAIAMMTGLLGVFVVQRGLAFLGSGLAHASFGGIALGALVAYAVGGAGLLAQPLWVALPFTLAAALAIAWVRDRTDLSSDTAIGVFFAVAVALGVLFLSLIPPDANVVDVYHLLFGSILAVGPADLRIILVTATAVLALLILTWGRLAYATFDADLAAADGLPVRLLDYGLFAVAAVAVVVSAQVVGIVLMAAYLVIPAAAARLAARSLVAMSVGAVTIGVTTTLVGLFASYVADVPSGAAIILLQALVFGVAAVTSRR